MAKIGRNDPCPCGSGKKYKKCCLTRDEARLAAEAQAAPDPMPMFLEDDDLDELSNSVVDLIHDNRLDEALAACDKLDREYPEVIDGLERRAMVHEARGDWALAAAYYRRALDFTERDDQRDGFEEEGRAYYRRKVAQTEARLAANQPPSPPPTATPSAPTDTNPERRTDIKHET
jgi:tetratricopeptide (TPR) repeat protein